MGSLLCLGTSLVTVCRLAYCLELGRISELAGTRPVAEALCLYGVVENCQQCQRKKQTAPSFFLVMEVCLISVNTQSHRITLAVLWKSPMLVHKGLLNDIKSWQMVCQERNQDYWGHKLTLICQTHSDTIFEYPRTDSLCILRCVISIVLSQNTMYKIMCIFT